MRVTIAGLGMVGNGVLILMNKQNHNVRFQTKDGITNDNTGTHYLDTLSGVYIEELSTRYEGEGEEQYQEDYVTKAIKYELKSKFARFDVKFTRLSTEPCPVSSFVFENQAAAIGSQITEETV